METLDSLKVALRNLRLNSRSGMDVLLFAERTELKIQEIQEEEATLNRIDADISQRFEIGNEAAIKEEMRSLLNRYAEHKINVLSFVSKTKKEADELLNKPAV